MKRTAADEYALAQDFCGEFGRSLVENGHYDFDDIVNERNHSVAHLLCGDVKGARRTVRTAAADGVTALVVDVEGKSGFFEILDGELTHFHAVIHIKAVDYGVVKSVACDIDGATRCDTVVGDCRDFGFSAADIHEKTADAVGVSKEAQARFHERDFLYACLYTALFHRASVRTRRGFANGHDGFDSWHKQAFGDNLFEEIMKKHGCHLFVDDDALFDGSDDSCAAERTGHNAFCPITCIADF